MPGSRPRGRDAARRRGPRAAARRPPSSPSAALPSSRSASSWAPSSEPRSRRSGQVPSCRPTTATCLPLAAGRAVRRDQGDAVVRRRPLRQRAPGNLLPLEVGEEGSGAGVRQPVDEPRGRFEQCLRPRRGRGRRGRRPLHRARARRRHGSASPAACHSSHRTVSACRPVLGRPGPLLRPARPPPGARRAPARGSSGASCAGSSRPATSRSSLDRSPPALELACPQRLPEPAQAHRVDPTHRAAEQFPRPPRAWSVAGSSTAGHRSAATAGTAGSSRTGYLGGRRSRDPLPPPAPGATSRWCRAERTIDRHVAPAEARRPGAAGAGWCATRPPAAAPRRQHVPRHPRCRRWAPDGPAGTLHGWAPTEPIRAATRASDLAQQGAPCRCTVLHTTSLRRPGRRPGANDHATPATEPRPGAAKGLRGCVGVPRQHDVAASPTSTSSSRCVAAVTSCASSTTTSAQRSRSAASSSGSTESRLAAASTMPAGS